MTIKLDNIRISFPKLWTPDSTYGRFGGSFLVEPGSKNEALVTRAVKLAITDKFPNDKHAAWDGDLPGPRAYKNFCYKHWNEYDPEKYSDYEGYFILSTSSKTRISTVNRNGKDIITEEDGIIYPGCRVRAYLDIWALNSSEFGKQINATLKGVQYWGEDKPLGPGGSMSIDSFDAIEDEDDDESF